MYSMIPRTAWNQVLYTSVTNLSTSSNTGIIATSLATAGGQQSAIFPLTLLATGNNMVSDETNIITIDWYINLAGDGGSIGQTVFSQLTAGNLSSLIYWPLGAAGNTAGQLRIPLWPYCQIGWTLAGTSKSMGFTIYMSSLIF